LFEKIVGNREWTGDPTFARFLRWLKNDLGLGGLSKIADETGGECYSLGTSNRVGFKPYLDRFQKNLNNHCDEAQPKCEPGKTHMLVANSLRPLCDRF
jgi:hypothetical protein